MKRIQNAHLIDLALVTVFLVFFTTVTAQTKTINRFYLQGGLGGGTYNSSLSDVGLQAIFKNKFVGTLSWQQLTMTPKNEPADYQPETGYVLFIPYTYEVDATMNLVSLTAGRSFKLGRNTWASVEGGPSFVSGEKVSYKPTQVVGSFVLFAASTSSNYTTTKEHQNTVGLALKSDINWAFASFMGLGAGAYANLNSVQSPVGLQAKLMIGDMGRVKKHKRH